MAAPNTHQASGGREASRLARDIYAEYTAINVLVTQMDAASDLSLKRLGQLVDRHAGRLTDMITPLPPIMRRAVRKYFGNEGIDWDSTSVMMTDLQAVAAGGLALKAYCDANVPELADGMSKILMATSGPHVGNLIETDIVIAKTPSHAAAIKTLRDVFE